jgi:hypothetical protein
MKIAFVLLKVLVFFVFFIRIFMKIAFVLQKCYFLMFLQNNKKKILLRNKNYFHTSMDKNKK